MRPAAASRTAVDQHAGSATATRDDPGWIGGSLTFAGRGETVRTWLRLGDVLGRQGGYDTLRGARIAAAHLTRGEHRAASAVARDGDGRYRLYAASHDAFDGVGETRLAFERERPRTPGGAVLGSWIFRPADGLVEVRDGVALLHPVWS